MTFGTSGDPLVVTVTMACGTRCLARAIQSIMRLSVNGSFIRNGSMRRSPGSLRALVEQAVVQRVVHPLVRELLGHLRIWAHHARGVARRDRLDLDLRREVERRSHAAMSASCGSSPAAAVSPAAAATSGPGAGRCSALHHAARRRSPSVRRVRRPPRARPDLRDEIGTARRHQAPGRAVVELLPRGPVVGRDDREAGGAGFVDHVRHAFADRRAGRGCRTLEDLGTSPRRPAKLTWVSAVP